MSKVIFITGASSGIGAALAVEHAKHGHDLVLCARREERLAEVKRQVKAVAPQVKCITAKCDVTKREELEAAVKKGLHALDKLDVVYANAGFGIAGRFEKLTIEDFRRQFETNIFGMLHTIYATLAELKKSRGNLVLIGSANSYISEPKKAPYCMSKFAVRALADSLYWELKPSGVDVTLICPGIIESEIRRVDKQGEFDPKAIDPAPRHLMMRTDQAAAQIFKAVEARKKEKVITLHGKVSVLAARHAPILLTPVLRTGKSVSRG